MTVFRSMTLSPILETPLVSTPTNCRNVLSWIVDVGLVLFSRLRGQAPCGLVNGTLPTMVDDLKAVQSSNLLNVNIYSTALRITTLLSCRGLSTSRILRSLPAKFNYAGTAEDEKSDKE
ncbi:unnamed protein product [Clavelina lepadiformis]|uniref:Uncharacterized protein n=1 Tax=Clavelina lepadiformis TaxID=159417 RepID=A0ABP0GHX1_CLALP